MKTSQIVTPAALLTALLISGHAAAAPIAVTLADGWWGLGGGWGAACTGAACDGSHTQLNVGWSVDGGLVGTSFQLSHLGDKQTVRFGSALFAEEDGTIAASEVDDLGLAAFLRFSSPTLGLTNNTAVVSATVGALKDIGSLNKELEVDFASALLNFASGGQIEVDFSSLTWNCQGMGHCTYRKPDNSWVDATFTLVREAQTVVDGGGGGGSGGGIPTGGPVAATSVPEPSSIALLAVGLVGLGLGRRRMNPKLVSCPA